MAPAPSARVLLLAAVGAASLAGARCPGSFDGGTLAAACAGGVSAGTVRFCFGGGCTGSGAVSQLVGPPPPFAVTGLRVEGTLGSVPVLGFPVVLLPGDRLAIDVRAQLDAPGTARASIELVVSTLGDDGDDDQGEAGATGEAMGPVAGTCRGDVEASVPQCGGGGGPCVTETCVDGACVAVPAVGPCDDGDACTVGDACRGGVCQPGPPKSCADLCRTGAECVAGECVGGTPVSCDDGIACTLDTCAPGVGCVHAPDDGPCATGDPCRPGRCTPGGGCRVQPVSGPGCDDGDACTSDDRCAGGTCRGKAVACADATPCTDDRCRNGACVHVPVDARCDDGACTAGVCRPGTPGADELGCVGVPVGEGEGCTDDGVPCTDDVCTAGGCLHVPVDQSCTAPGDDACVLAACAPERLDRDAAGCVATSVADGAECSEDGDPCSTDVCTDGACRHLTVVEPALCAPIVAPFRKALGLANAARTLRQLAADARRAAGTGDVAAADSFGDRLDLLEAQLVRTARVLAGKVVPDPPRHGPLDPTSAQSRARAALRVLRRAPARAQAVRRLAATPGLRKAVGGPMAKDLGRRGRLLLTGTKTLKADLRRILRFSETFAR